MDKSLTTKIVAFVVVLFLVLTVFGQIYVRKAGSVGTEVAMRYESRENIEFSAVFIRNEHTVSRHIDGIIRYTHEDGAKLAKNSVAASIYANAADVELCGRIEKLELKIKTLEDAQSLAGTDSSQIEAFNKLINEKHSELIDAIDSGDYKLCGELKYQLLNLQAKRDMAKGRVTSYKDAIDKLYAEKATLSGQISRTPEELILGETGYFVSTVDGYESTLDMDGVRSLSPEAIEGIIEKPVNGECDSTVIGKIVDSYKWKAAAVMDSKQVISVTEGSTVELYVGTGGMTVSAVVELVEKYDNDKNVVVFAGDELNSALSSARTEHFKLLVDSYNGIRISSQAIHFDVDNNVGVYIIDGNTAKFVRIKRIYSGDGYVIAEDTTDSTGYLSLYDRIIKDGKDVYDGKVL